MGCDEHMHVEVRGADGWRSIPPPEPVGSELGEWGNWHHYRRRYPNDYDGQPSVQWHFDRYYDSYAAMAGVRVSSESPEPLAEGRGLPPDVSADVEATHQSDGMDAHSATWFTLDELAAYPHRTERMDELAVQLRLVAEREGVGPDAVRVVVWFDN